MATARYGMKFSSGYLNGGKNETGKEAPSHENAVGGDHHAQIHEHLQAMHESTGKAHSHVEHHGDGSHTSHHIHDDGSMEGPHEHPDHESLSAKMQEMGGGEPEDDDEQGTQDEFGGQ